MSHPNINIFIIVLLNLLDNFVCRQYCGYHGVVGVWLVGVGGLLGISNIDVEMFLSVEVHLKNQLW